MLGSLVLFWSFWFELNSQNFYYVYDNEVPAPVQIDCRPDNERIDKGIRCCSGSEATLACSSRDNEGNCYGDNVALNDNKLFFDYTNASLTCSANGGRVCTLDEYISECIFTGCFIAHRQAWTSSQCIPRYKAGRADNEDKQCVSASNTTKTVRCCSLDLTQCYSEDTGSTCYDEVSTIHNAVQLCEDDGRRLCGENETTTICASSDCGYDDNYVWSKTLCGVIDSPTQFPTQITSNSSINPSKNPFDVSTLLPSELPSHNPSLIPSKFPSTTPSDLPTKNPSKIPTHEPTNVPSQHPTKTPTLAPSNNPTTHPSKIPTANPSNFPSNLPSYSPTDIPTQLPTINPSIKPTNNPSENPSDVPTLFPTLGPTLHPTLLPSELPSHTPSLAPSNLPSHLPSNVPSLSPTMSLTKLPTTHPSHYPSEIPTVNPSTLPTNFPIPKKRQPSNDSSKSSTIFPTMIPTIFPVNDSIFSPTKHLNTNNILSQSSIITPVITVGIFILLLIVCFLVYKYKHKITHEKTTFKSAISMSQIITSGGLQTLTETTTSNGLDTPKTPNNLSKIKNKEIEDEEMNIEEMYRVHSDTSEIGNNENFETPKPNEIEGNIDLNQNNPNTQQQNEGERDEQIILPKDFTIWTTEQILHWLRFEVKLPQYCDLFEQNEIDSTVLQVWANKTHEMIENELKFMGINIYGHRVKIRDRIEKLNEKINQKPTEYH